MPACTSLAESSSGMGGVTELRFVCLRPGDALAQLAARASGRGRLQYGDGPVVLFDDDLDALFRR